MTTQATKTIAFIIYQGLTPLDLVGPLQVLSTFSVMKPEYQVVVVSEKIEPIISDAGLRFLPDKTFTDVPCPFAIVVPGGNTPTEKAMTNPAIRAYVRSAAQTAEVIGSVCTGALILASVGLLKDKPATTHWAYEKFLEQFGVRYERIRWVDDGKIVMSAGVSAGIDWALYLVAKLSDEATARQVQLALQYDPHPPFGRIDWQHLDFLPRMLRLMNSLRAPFATAQAKQMLKMEQN